MAGTHPRVRHHEEPARDHRRRLLAVFVITVAYMLAESVGGFLSNSLALISDAGHMLTDAAALLMAMMAFWFSKRPSTPEKTYGYYRMEILAALANGVALVVISIVIFYEALQRLRSPEPVHALELLVIASGGLIVNGVSAALLHSGSQSNLNMRGAFLHVIGDALGSIGAIVAGVLIWWKGWTEADSIISVAICALIVYSSWRLIRESVNILLEGTPFRINVRAVIEAMQKVEGVVEVHDLHIWSISSEKEALSAHVTITPGASHRAALDALRDSLRNRFNIGHVTLQIESQDEAGQNGKLYQILRRR